MHGSSVRLGTWLIAVAATTIGLVMVAACTDDHDDESSRISPEGGGRTGESSCPGVPTPLPTPSADAGGECLVDGDCTAGKAGRCALGSVPDAMPVNECRYSQCAVDSDCPGAKATCHCYGSGYICLDDSNCRTNADCPSGERCIWSAPAFPPLAKGVHIQNGIHGFFCTTPRDDCTTPMSSGPMGGCVWDPKLNRWAKRSDT